jgi:hypothetical protein
MGGRSQPGREEVGDQAQTILILGLDQITKFICRLDGPHG